MRIFDLFFSKELFEKKKKKKRIRFHFLILIQFDSNDFEDEEDSFWCFAVNFSFFSSLIDAFGIKWKIFKSNLFLLFFIEFIWKKIFRFVFVSSPISYFRHFVDQKSIFISVRVKKKKRNVKEFNLIHFEFPDKRKENPIETNAEETKIERKRNESIGFGYYWNQRWNFLQSIYMIFTWIVLVRLIWFICSWKSFIFVDLKGCHLEIVGPTMGILANNVHVTIFGNGFSLWRWDRSDIFLQISLVLYFHQCWKSFGTFVIHRFLCTIFG